MNGRHAGEPGWLSGHVVDAVVIVVFVVLIAGLAVWAATW